MKVPLPYVVRDAAHKSVADIHAEIRAAQGDPTWLAAMRRPLRLLGLVPAPLRWLAWRVLARSPHLRKRFGGTVVVTSVGTATSGPGWALPRVAYPVTLAVGGIGPRPVLEHGALEAREHLTVTLALDHDVVDGAPAARFAARLRDLIVQGDGLAYEPLPITRPST